jgi:CBS domain-containing protein
MRRTVRGILDRKGSEVWAVRPADTVYSALQVMADNNIGAVLVLEGSRIAGILSERDYARKVILEQRSSMDTKVADIMTAEVVTVGPDDDVDRCMNLMTDGRFRHLPVVEGDGNLVGLVSIGDVVRTIIDSQQSMINDLERYITS